MERSTPISNLTHELYSLSEVLQHSEGDEEKVANIVIKVLEIVAKDANLWKSFKGWAKQNKIKPANLDRSDVYCGALKFCVFRSVKASGFVRNKWVNIAILTHLLRTNRESFHAAENAKFQRPVV